MRERGMVEGVVPSEIQRQAQESNFLADVKLRLNLCESRVVGVGHV